MANEWQVALIAGGLAAATAVLTNRANKKAAEQQLAQQAESEKTRAAQETVRFKAQLDAEMKRLRAQHQADADQLKMQHGEAHLRSRADAYLLALDALSTLAYEAPLLAPRMRPGAPQKSKDAAMERSMTLVGEASHQVNGVMLLAPAPVAEAARNAFVATFAYWRAALDAVRQGQQPTDAVLAKAHAERRRTVKALHDVMRADVAPNRK